MKQEQLKIIIKGIRDGTGTVELLNSCARPGRPHEEAYALMDDINALKNAGRELLDALSEETI